MTHICGTRGRWDYFVSLLQALCRRGFWRVDPRVSLHTSWDYRIFLSFIMEFVTCYFIHHGIILLLRSSWDYLCVTSYIMGLLHISIIHHGIGACNFIHHGIILSLHSSWDYLCVTSYIMGLLHISIIHHGIGACNFIHHGIILSLHSSWDYLCVTSFIKGWPHISIMGLLDCYFIHHGIICHFIHHGITWLSPHLLQDNHGSKSACWIWKLCYMYLFIHRMPRCGYEIISWRHHHDNMETLSVWPFGRGFHQ